jgi:hypothetical protein
MYRQPHFGDFYMVVSLCLTIGEAYPYYFADFAPSFFRFPNETFHKSERSGGRKWALQSRNKSHGTAQSAVVETHLAYHCLWAPLVVAQGVAVSEVNGQQKGANQAMF